MIVYMGVYGAVNRSGRSVELLSGLYDATATKGSSCSDRDLLLCPADLFFFSPYLAANCNLIPLLDGYVTRQCVISNTSIYLCDQRLRQRQPDGSGFFALDADADADASSIMRHLPCMA